ncbi:MAG: hypothetical protein ACI8XG_001081, partial [Congregibacter sp.]
DYHCKKVRSGQAMGRMLIVVLSFFNSGELNV